MWEAGNEPKLKCAAGSKNAFSPVGIFQVPSDKPTQAEAGKSLEGRLSPHPLSPREL